MHLGIEYQKKKKLWYLDEPVWTHFALHISTDPAQPDRLPPDDFLREELINELQIVGLSCDSS